ncbi:MAG: winged helix-turn-helix transcriptional regulator [Bacteroidales bacterium]|nr:winged helix-turn-helix transcriptional regulator [Bacteroidales bacterium]
MRRSKMEMHLDIIKTLAQKGPLKLTHIMYKANVNCSVLGEQLEFLMQQNIVQEKTLKKERIIYELTEKGFSIIKAFREIQTLLPIEEEKQRIPAILY